MKQLITIMAIAFTTQMGFSQVGINTTKPKATLDIKANNTDGSTIEGVVLPSLSKEAMAAMGTTVEEGTVIYCNDASTGSGATVLNVISKGFYIFNNGTWNGFLDKGNVDKNKVYVCNNQNIGQILKTTGPGYFICNQEGQEGDYPYQAPRWKYVGLYKVSITEEDDNHQPIVKFIASLPSDDILAHGYFYSYALNGVPFPYDSTSGLTPNGNGFLDTLPSIGHIRLTYVPDKVCMGSSLYPDNTFVRGITGSGGGSYHKEDCNNDGGVAKEAIIYLDYMILE